MHAVLLLTAQVAATATPAPAAVPILPSQFELAPLEMPGLDSPTACPPTGDPSAIVVCGRRRVSDYPLDAWQRIFTPRPIRAEAALGPNLIVRGYAESVAIGSATSTRAMIGLRLRF